MDYNYNDLINSVKKGEISLLYCFYGEESYLIERVVNYIQKILSKKEEGEVEVTLLSGDSVKIEEILEEALTPPIFSKKRLLIIKNADILINTNQDLLLKYVKNPSPKNIMIIWAEQIDKRKKFLDHFEKAGGVICEFRRLNKKNLSEFICRECKNLGKEINSDVAYYLIDSVGDNLKIIFNELDKIILYLGNRSKVTIEDIDEVTCNIRIDKIFSLIDTICEKNVSKAINLLNKLFEIDEPHLKVLSLIIRQFRLIGSVKAMYSKNTSHKEIAYKLQLQPFILDKILEQANNFTYDRIKKIFEKLKNADIMLKSSRISKNIILEKLIIELCN